MNQDRYLRETVLRDGTIRREWISPPARTAREETAIWAAHSAHLLECKTQAGSQDSRSLSREPPLDRQHSGYSEVWDEDSGDESEICDEMAKEIMRGQRAIAASMKAEDLPGDKKVTPLKLRIPRIKDEDIQQYLEQPEILTHLHLDRYTSRAERECGLLVLRRDLLFHLPHEKYFEELLVDAERLQHVVDCPAAIQEAGRENGEVILHALIDDKMSAFLDVQEQNRLDEKKQDMSCVDSNVSDTSNHPESFYYMSSDGMNCETVPHDRSQNRREARCARVQIPSLERQAKYAEHLSNTEAQGRKKRVAEEQAESLRGKASEHGSPKRRMLSSKEKCMLQRTSTNPDSNVDLDRPCSDVVAAAFSRRRNTVPGYPESSIFYHDDMNLIWPRKTKRTGSSTEAVVGLNVIKDEQESGEETAEDSDDSGLRLEREQELEEHPRSADPRGGANTQSKFLPQPPRRPVNQRFDVHLFPEPTSGSPSSFDGSIDTYFGRVSFRNITSAGIFLDDEDEDHDDSPEEEEDDSPEEEEDDSPEEEELEQSQGAQDDLPHNERKQQDRRRVKNLLRQYQEAFRLANTAGPLESVKSSIAPPLVSKQGLSSEALELHTRRSRVDLPRNSSQSRESSESTRRARSPTRSWWSETSPMPISTQAGGIRQPPSPAAQSQSALPQQSQSNGLSNGLIPNGIPHAGQQTDINYLWGIVQELSDVLAHNRSQTATLVEQVRRMEQQRHQRVTPNDSSPVAGNPDGSASQPPLTNGDHVGHPATSSATTDAAIEIANLRSQLHTANTQVSSLSDEVHSQANINDEYVNFLNGIMEKLRTYALSHSEAVIAIHKHYNKLLEEERDSNLQLRIEHGEWQAALGRAAEWARKALRERSEETQGLERKMRECKAENKVLRSLLGWEVPPDDDSDAEEEPQSSKVGPEGSSDVSSNQGRRRGLRGLAGRSGQAGGAGTVGGGGQGLT